MVFTECGLGGLPSWCWCTWDGVAELWPTGVTLSGWSPVSLRGGPDGDKAEGAQLQGTSHRAEAGLRAAWSLGPRGEQRCVSSGPLTDRDVLSTGRRRREVWEAGPGPRKFASGLFLRVCLICHQGSLAGWRILSSSRSQEGAWEGGGRHLQRLGGEEARLEVFPGLPSAPRSGVRK